jgi:hypothetical protein
MCTKTSLIERGRVGKQEGSGNGTGRVGKRVGTGWVGKPDESGKETGRDGNLHSFIIIQDNYTYFHDFPRLTGM